MASAISPTTVDILRRVIRETPPPKLLIEKDELARLKRFQDVSCQTSEEERQIVLKQYLDVQVPDADEVYPGIYVGNACAGQNINFLKDLGISAVVNCAQGTAYDQINTTEELFEGTGIRYLGLNMADNDSIDISQYMDTTMKFIDAALENSGKILLHCLMGMSRSPAIVAMYLMSRKSFSAEEALRTIGQRRQVFPNDGFLKQMCEMENNK